MKTDKKIEVLDVGMAILLGTIKILTPENHNPDCIIMEGTFRKENGELATLNYYGNIHNKKDWGFEYYSGKNYIVDSNERSYSLRWERGKNMPKKYEHIGNQLMMKCPLWKAKNLK